jgi:hypothetical protein
LIVRRRLGFLTVTTWLALTAAVVTAAPAGARNVGGTVPAGATCIEPGGVILAGQAQVPCICYSTGMGIFPAVGRGEECPPGAQRVKIDRNVGG